jgi:flagellar biosynthesis protein FlhF
MRVKKFEAKNMRDALQMVKHELGPDAVILSARDNRKSFGIGGQASVEITAAVSDSTLQKKRFVESRMTTVDRERFNGSDARTQREFINSMVERRTRQNAEEERPRRPITSVSYIDIPDEGEQNPRRSAALDKAAGRNVRELLEDFEQDFEEETLQRRPVRSSAPAPSRQALRQPPLKASAQKPLSRPLQKEEVPEEAASENALTRIRSAAREAWQAGIFTTDEPRPKAQENGSGAGGLEMVASGVPAKQDAELATLKGEIDRLQKMLEGFQKVPQSFVTMHPGADFAIPFELSFMFQKLTDAGVTVDHAVEMLQQAAKEIDPVQMKKRPIVDAWVARQFLTHIQTVSSPFQGRLHLFVGGAGSGKTSTLVKLASQLVVKEKKKIAILTTDAYKVGAVDQLKIYCQILNVPFAVIRSRKDWEWVLGQLQNVDHVLVDFPGFQMRDLDEIHLLKSLLPPPEAQAHAHFCISATAKDGDAYEIARRYKVADYADLIFTNLDQSVQHGIIYNLHKKTGKPLHSFGTGNRIPEDFEVATKERVLDLIFKLTKLRRETK